MIDTLTSKCKTKDLSKKILNLKSSVANFTRNTSISEWAKSYYHSNANVLTSLNVYYSHDVMGKAKYLNVRKANRRASFKNTEVPNYVPYKMLAETINNIDIGVLNAITETNGQESFKGAYRNPAEYILRIAEFYLKIDMCRIDKLRTFDCFPKKDPDSFLFVLAIGGDGAPGSGTTVLVSFLNCGKRVASSSENFLLFGGNVEENSAAVRNFFSKLTNDVKYLESAVFEINNIKVEFKLGELPNDMKMLSFLAGELSNSSTYFLTFANVSKQDANDAWKTFGTSHEHQWRPWNYQRRVTDANKVIQKKAEFAKLKASAATQRTKLTSYISGTLKSRQEEIPLVLSFIDNAKSEPLHLKNNTIKELFMKLFKICTANTDFKNSKCYNNIPSDTLFIKFVIFIHDDMKCNFLSKKMQAWFNDNCGKTEKDFGFRFRGKESFLYMKHFMYLIDMILGNVTDEAVKLCLHQVYYQSIHLRKLLSYAVRIVD